MTDKKNVNLLASQWQEISAFHYAIPIVIVQVFTILDLTDFLFFDPFQKINSFWGTYGRPVNSFACFKDMMVTQNYNNISRDHDHAHLWWFLIPTLILAVAYQCTRFEHFSFLYLRSKDMKEDPKI